MGVNTKTKQQTSFTIRKAEACDVHEIHTLVASYQFTQDSGSLIPLSPAEVAARVGHGDFIVADVDGHEAGCASVVAYNGGERVAELRSLAVGRTYQGNRIGPALVDACVGMAQEGGHHELYALIQEKDAGMFARHGFVPAEKPPQKLMNDCVRCPRYSGGCNETAVVYRFPQRL